MRAMRFHRALFQRRQLLRDLLVGLALGHEPGALQQAMVSSRRSSLQGFSSQPKAPFCTASTAMGMSPWPERKMTTSGLSWLRSAPAA